MDRELYRDPGPKIGPRPFWAQFFLTQYGYADSRRPSKSFLEAGLAEAGLVEDGMVEPVFPGALARLQLGIASEINISLLGPGTGTMGPYGPREPWALRAHGPWALWAQGRALRARWALRAHLSPCRSAEDDFFAPYTRSKVCRILVAP